MSLEKMHRPARLLVITASYIPDHPRKDFGLVRELLARGHTVTHIIWADALPNYPLEFLDDKACREVGSIYIRRPGRILPYLVNCDVVIVPVHRGVSIFVEWAHALGKLVVQHDNYPGFDNYYWGADYVAVKGEYFRQDLVQRYGLSPDKVVPVGCIQFDEIRSPGVERTTRDEFCRLYGLDPHKRIAVWLPSSAANQCDDWSQEHYRRVCQIVRESPNHQLIIKPHPSEYVGHRSAVLNGRRSWEVFAPGAPVCRPEHAYALFRVCDVGISLYSTVAIELGLFRKPFIYLDPLSSPVMQRIAEKPWGHLPQGGWGFWAEDAPQFYVGINIPLTELPAALAELKYLTGSEEDFARLERVYSYAVDGKTAQRIADLVERATHQVNQEKQQVGAGQVARLVLKRWRNFISAYLLGMERHALPLTESSNRMRQSWRIWLNQASTTRDVLSLSLPYLRPFWRRASIATSLSLAATILGGITTLVTSSIIQALITGTPQVTGSTGIPQLSGLFDLDNTGEIVLKWVNTHLGELRDSQQILAVLVGLVIALTILTVVTDAVGRILWTEVRTKYTRQMQVDFFAHICSLSLSFFTHQKSAELVSRLEFDLSGVATLIQTILNTLIRSPFTFIMFFIILIRTSTLLTGVAIGMAMLYLLISSQIGKLAKRRHRQKYKNLAALMSVVSEAFLSIRVVKAFDAESFEKAKFQREVNDYVNAEIKDYLFSSEIPKTLTPVLNILVMALVTLVGLREIALNHLTQQGLLLFLGASALMFVSAASIGNAIMFIYTATGAASEVLRIWRTKPQVADGWRETPPSWRELDLQAVSFRYGDEWVLKDINLCIRRGEMIALVGPSGAGKTTLADLILRLYDPTEGYIKLDGVNIREFTLATYRRMFGVVSQEALLFNDTIRNNIAYGRSGLTEEQIIRAAKVANAHDFIMELSEQYDTHVGDRGIRLSGGQRQRIAIARAIAAKPHILILDEATSALDNESEQQVQRAIEQVIRDCTVVVIAHRLSTIQKADRIIVLDRGRVVEQGSHADLLRLKGLYRHLYDLQFADHLIPTTVRSVAPTN